MQVCIYREHTSEKGILLIGKKKIKRMAFILTQLFGH